MQAGHDPVSFQALPTFGAHRTLEHPAWDGWWPAPSLLDIDELVDQFTAEQQLVNAQELALTVKAHREAREAVASSVPVAPITNIYNTIVNSQVAGGDITDSTTIVDVLVQVEQALDELDDVEPDVKDEAKGLLRRLLGKGAEGGGEVVSDTAGALVSAMLSKHLGLPPWLTRRPAGRARRTAAGSSSQDPSQR